MKQLSPWGLSLAINLYQCDHQLLTDRRAIKNYVREIIDLIGMVAHGPCHIDQFGEGKLYGFSAMQFIETSSITVHLDDQRDRAFIDIFSCKPFDTKAARDFSKQYFNAQSIKSTTLVR